MPRGLQTEFARGIAGHQPGLQHARFNDVTTLGAYTFAVERRRGQPLQQMRMFFDGQPLGQDLFAKAVEQEGRFTVNAAAADRPNQMAKQAGRHFGSEQHRCVHGRQFTRCQTGQRAACALCANPFRVFQIAHFTGDGIRVIALHVAFVLGDD